MTAGMERADVEQFRSRLAERVGLCFEDSKLAELEEVLRGRVRETGCWSVSSYLSRLDTPAYLQIEVRALAEALTVQESYFFRYSEHFRAFVDVALPSRLRARREDRRLRLLSAGAATGEEAYTMAILVKEHVREPNAWKVVIEGIDLHPTALERARRGHYSSWSLRETPAAIRSRYFTESRGEFALDPEVRAMVAFHERNLVDEEESYWEPAAFDVIFCRNVLIYFSPDAIRCVVARLSRALAPGGFLFLGHVETLRGVSQEFHLIHTHDTFYYQRRDAAESSPAQIATGPLVMDPPSLPWPADAGRGGRQGDALDPPVEPATGRSRVVRPVSPRPAPVTTPDPGIASALDLFRRERFEETTALLLALPSESGADPDALLLLGAALANKGDLAEAERVCRRVLELEELSAGAHYLLALCRDQAGDLAATLHHARTAVYLDPTFALPYLHLGRLARRSGDAEAATRNLMQARSLLAREDPSRILLFGGGFHRAALIQLCEAELRAGGRGRR